MARSIALQGRRRGWSGTTNPTAVLTRRRWEGRLDEIEVGEAGRRVGADCDGEATLDVGVRFDDDLLLSDVVRFDDGSHRLVAASTTMATRRGKWRRNGGGNGKREASMAAMATGRGRRRGEGGGDGGLGESERARRFGGVGSGPGQLRTGYRVPLHPVFLGKKGKVAVHDGLPSPVANNLTKVP